VKWGFQPRNYQFPLLNALESGIKRAVFVAHRRAGKDILAFNWAVMMLLENPGWTAFHILPTYNQAKKVIWDANTNESKRLLDYIPPEVIEQKNGQEMKIRLTNGSLYWI
jgi:phage terminase large subunit